ncbi:hypothetical protein D6D06_06725, partial [Aureobasidium pullulans]
VACLFLERFWRLANPQGLGRQSGDSGTLLLLSLMAMRFIVDCAQNSLLGVSAAREGKTPSKDDVSGLIQWHAGRNLHRVYRTLTTTRHSQNVCRPGNAPHIALLLSSKMAPFKVPKLLSVEIGAGGLENRFLFGEVHLTCRITNVDVSTIKHLDGEHGPGKSTLLPTAPKGFNKEGELLCRMFDFHFQPTEGFRTTNKSWERDRHDLSLEPGHHNGEDD